MKKSAKLILKTTACALTLIASQSGIAAKAHDPASRQPMTASTDSLAYSATKTLIESVSELSKTANKLSETALRLIEAQQQLDAAKPEKKTTPSPQNTATEISENPHTVITVRDTIYLTVRDTVADSVISIAEDIRDGGQYVWVPDADLPSVEALLAGQELKLPVKVDLSEMTYWRGDSIPMALPTKRLGRYDRKLYNWLIYPKGLWHIGLTANYGELNTEDMEILTLINDIDLHGKIYSIKPSVSYFLRNNLCVGMRLAFTKGNMGVDSFNVDIDEDMSFNLHDIRYTSDSYAAAIFLQQYFGLSRRGRFAVFNEVEMSVGQGNTHFIRPFGGELRDTRTRSQSFNINYSPGVSIMMMKNAAFNLSFGIFGFHLKDEKQWENGEESGSRFTSGINFRFNIFNINFGVSIII